MTTHFYNGYEVIITAEVPGMKNKVIVRPIKDLRLKKIGIPADMLVDKDKLEIPIYEAFKVGDHVRNKFGSMVGKISAFELHTNSAVVVSDKIGNYKDKSTRYTYHVSALELCGARDIRIVPGCWYKVNNTFKLLAVQSVFSEDEVMLFNKDGEIVFRGLPKHVNRDWLLLVHSIETIEMEGKVK